MPSVHAPCAAANCADKYHKKFTTAAKQQQPATMSDQQGGSVLDPDTLSLDQLSQLKTQEENKLTAITQRYGQLRAVSARYHASKDAISELQGDATDGKEIMVPLTDSVYVPGKMRKSDKVCDIVYSGKLV